MTGRRRAKARGGRILAFPPGGRRRETSWRPFARRVDHLFEPLDMEAYQDRCLLDGDGTPPNGVAALAYPRWAIDMTGDAMLATVLTAPPEDVPAILRVLTRDVGAGRERRHGYAKLQRSAQDEVVRAHGVLRETIEPGMPLLEAAFRSYSQATYWPTQKADMLVRKAEGRLGRSAGASVAAFGRAGALALQGQSLWYRWPEELSGPLDAGVTLVTAYCRRLDALGLRPLEPADDMRSRAKDVLSILRANQGPPDLCPADWPFVGSRLTRWMLLHSSARAHEALELVVAHLRSGGRGVGDLSPLRSLPPDALLEACRTYVAIPADGRRVPVAVGAINLAAELAVPGTAELLLDVALDAWAEPHDPVRKAALLRLADIEPPPLQPICDAVTYAFDVDIRLSLAGIIARIGRVTDEALQALIYFLGSLTWEAGRAEVASILGDLGDPRGLAALEMVRDDPEAEDDDLELVEDAIQRLEGRTLEL
ncbi:MAG: hypothetical protein ACE5EL_00565 [Anaerolineae bacterium]